MAFASLSARAAAAAPLLLAAACADVAWVDVQIPPGERCSGDLARVNLLEPILYELPDGATCSECFDHVADCDRVPDVPCRCGARTAIAGSDLQRLLSGLEVPGLSGADHCLQVRAWEAPLLVGSGECECATGMLRACAVGQISPGEPDANLSLVCPEEEGFDVNCGVD